MDGKGSLPGRHEIPDEFKWRLEDIYPSNEEWEKTFNRSGWCLRWRLSGEVGLVGRNPAGSAGTGRPFAGID